MNKIIIKTQAEWDALPKSFEEFTHIYIESVPDFWLSVNNKIGNARVVARESSHVEAWGSSHVVAWESSHVEAWGSSHVEAWGSSHVEAWGSSHVVARESSHVVARESSHVVARESSHVVARESSHVVARESSHVVARGSSHVEAWGSSHVVAWESSHVEAWESSHVEAWGSSHVEAWGSSHVVASNEVAIHNHSASTVIEIAGYAVIFALKIAKFIKKSETSTIINLPPRQYSVEEWNERENTDKNEDKIILYKKVSSDWKTQEGEKNETVWLVGSVMSHPSWNPSEEECGEGKFHACSRAYFCDEFRDKPNDRYIAIEVDPSDMFTWSEPSYPHKAAFKAGKVLYECDRYGKKING